MNGYGLINKLLLVIGRELIYVQLEKTTHTYTHTHARTHARKHNVWRENNFTKLAINET